MGAKVLIQIDDGIFINPDQVFSVQLLDGKVRAFCPEGKWRFCFTGPSTTDSEDRQLEEFSRLFDSREEALLWLGKHFNVSK